VGLSDVRDIAIVVLAVESIIVAALAAYLILKLLAFVDVAQEHVEEMAKTAGGVLESAREAATAANEAATQVRGSTSFLSNQVVFPVIRGMAAVSGAAGFARSLVRPRRMRRKGGSNGTQR
jgi:hypothetical protein